MRSSAMAGSLSSVSTYKHCAVHESVKTTPKVKSYDVCAPAAARTLPGSLALFSKKPIKNGTNWISFMALRALFDVSLSLPGLLLNMTF